MGAGKSKRQALYFPTDMLNDIQGEAERQDRSISWLIQQAWRIARAELQKVPSTTDYFDKLENADASASAEVANPVPTEQGTDAKSSSDYGTSGSRTSGSGTT